MNEHALYNIKRGPHGYAIGKFDRDLNLLAAYNTSTDYCSCPAGPRPTCRHRKMLPRMLAKVDQPEFYCYETQTWHRPFAETSAEAQDIAAFASEAVSCPKPSTEPPIETELYGSMSPARKELLEEARETNERMEAKIMAMTSLAPSPTIRRR